jgi:Protein of unknown function (DUF4235)
MWKPRLLKMSGRERTWSLVSTGTGMVGAFLAQKVIRTAYTGLTRKRSPAAVFDPTSDRFSWPDVVVWAAAAGVGLGIAKVMSARVAAFGWEVATGSAPPAIDERT